MEDLMGKQRKQWPEEQKLTIVLAALRDDQSIAELSRQYGVNDNLISRWKAQCLAGGRQDLGNAKAKRPDQRLHAENVQRKKLLGEKALEIDILKQLSRLSACHRWRGASKGFRASYPFAGACVWWVSHTGSFGTM
jgi:putative transposase